MSSASLKDFIYRHKDHIVREIVSHLDRLPNSPYLDFILKTKEGRRRIKIWVEMVIMALDGDRERFFKDQERMAYPRIVRGFKLEFVMQFYLIFEEVLRKTLQGAVIEQKSLLPNLLGEIQELSEILLQGFCSGASSWVKAHEEQFVEKAKHLSQLYEFSKEIISIVEPEKIIYTALRETSTLFAVEKVCAAIYLDERLRGVYTYPVEKETPDISPIMEKVWREGCNLFVDEEGRVYSENNLFNLKRIACLPIRVHGRNYGAVALVNSTRGFRFTAKELSLLYQFLYIMGLAIENSFMLEQIQQQREESRFLANKMIALQEEERKGLASDIHDTVAQTLTGISYKMQYCKELARVNPELLEDQLDALINTIDQAIDQSRNLMSSLRPDLIDTMGLMPALKRHIDNFKQETGIRVTAHLTKKVKIFSEANICLFRVAQEALTNVHKHAETKTVEVILQEKDGNAILVVADNGKGFDMPQGTPWKKSQNKLGLLSMKERVEAIGGTLVINAGINRGCRIEAKVPLNAGVSHDAED